MFAIRPAALKGFSFLFKEWLLPILAKRVAFEAFPHQNAAQVGVTSELDAVQVPGFAFLEIHACPKMDERGNFDRVNAFNLNFENESSAAGGLVGVIDHFHFVFGDVVHCGDGGQQIVAKFVADGGCHFDETILADDKAAVAGPCISADFARKTGDQINSRSLKRCHYAPSFVAATCLISALRRTSIKSGPRIGIGT